MYCINGDKELASVSLTTSAGDLSVKAGPWPDTGEPAVAMGGGDPKHLADIRRPGISLAEWWRQPPVSISADEIIGLEPIRYTTMRKDVGCSLYAALDSAGQRHWHTELAADVEHLADRFTAIIEADRLALRLELIADNTCRRFHADQVRVRLLCTYVGPGTEETAARVHRLGTGHVGLFKGLDWAPTSPVFHRSPPIAGTGDRRLLLVIDAADAAG